MILKITLFFDKQLILSTNINTNININININKLIKTYSMIEK